MKIETGRTYATWRTMGIDWVQVFAESNVPDMYVVKVYWGGGDDVGALQEVDGDYIICNFGYQTYEEAEETCRKAMG